jgi:hypothetical protein
METYGADVVRDRLIQELNDDRPIPLRADGMPVNDRATRTMGDRLGFALTDARLGRR